MGKVRLTDTLKRRIAVAMLLLAALMLLDGIYQAGMHVKWRRWFPRTLAAERATTQPADTQPSETQPGDTQPGATQPPDTQPSETQPADTQPGATQPTGTQPAEPQLADAQPARTRPADSRPAGTRPAATRAAETHPIAKKSSGRRAARGGSKTKPKKVPAVHAAIKKRNIMAKPKPKGHGMQLTGVLGNIALFKTRDGKTVGIEEGKSGSGIKVKAIKGYEVTIEFEGKTETLKLFSERKERGRRPGRPPPGRPGGTSPRPGGRGEGRGPARRGAPTRDVHSGRPDRIAPGDTGDSGVARPRAAAGPSSRPMVKE